MKGGVILFRGSGTDARRYLESDRSRADHYYLEGGTVLAEFTAVHARGEVIGELGLTADEYAQWVDWINPLTGESMGKPRLPGEGRRGSPRFAEMVVNVPKSLSIAAALHPEVSQALDAAQRDAVVEIRSWLGQHSVTRVGPRGKQEVVAIEQLETVAVSHKTSRAGDPHRHIHFQIGTRVWAAGAWRGLDTGALPTLGVYADAWVEGLKLADSTIAGYKKLIRNHLRPQLEHYPLDKLTPTRIARHYRDLEQHGRKDEQDKGGPLSANTVHKAHVVLGAILDAAIEDGHLTTNPAKRKVAKAPTTSQMRAEKAELVTWTPDQLAAFLAWDRDEKQDELFALWWVIANTRMRRSEALALKWSDLNTTTSQISIRRAINTEDWTKTKTTKTGNARVIDIDAATVKVLASYKVARAELSFGLAKADAYIFGDDDGQPRSPDAMTSRWDRRLKWAVKVKKFEHLPRVTLKGLRHTHATILMELGVPPKVVEERLGHSTITTTKNIYSHVTPTMQKNAVEQFASRLAGT